MVGTIADVTEVKTAEERLLHDAVHDSLTACRTASCSGTGWTRPWPSPGRTRG